MSRLAGLALAFAVTGLSADAPATGSLWDDLGFRDLDGREWRRPELEGRVVLLDFWATWCAPCLAQFPVFREALERFGDDGLLIVGVSMNESDRATLERFLASRDVGWPQVHDGRGLTGPLARRFDVTALPRTVLVDRRGRVVGVDLEAELLLAALPALLSTER